MSKLCWTPGGYTTALDVVQYLQSLTSVDSRGITHGFHFGLSPCTGLKYQGHYNLDRNPIDQNDLEAFVRTQFHIYQSKLDHTKTVMVVKGLSHAAWTLQRLQSMVKTFIEYYSDFENAVVTRGYFEEAVNKCTPLYERLEIIAEVMVLLQKQYHSSATGSFFTPTACFVCHNCGFQKPIPSSYIHCCPSCVIPSHPYGHLIIHDHDLVMTVINALGGPEKCTIQTDDEFVTLVDSILQCEGLI